MALAKRIFSGAQPDSADSLEAGTGLWLMTAISVFPAAKT